MAGYKNKLNTGLKLTKDLFADIIQSDCVYNEDVWAVIEHAMVSRKLKKGYKGTILSHTDIDSYNRLHSVLEVICSVGYSKFLRTR